MSLARGAPLYYAYWNRHVPHPNGLCLSDPCTFACLALEHAACPSCLLYLSSRKIAAGGARGICKNKTKRSGKGTPPLCRNTILCASSLVDMADIHMTCKQVTDRCSSKSRDKACAMSVTPSWLDTYLTEERCTQDTGSGSDSGQDCSHSSTAALGRCVKLCALCKQMTHSWRHSFSIVLDSCLPPCVQHA
jgi:hypothetical protein